MLSPHPTQLSHQQSTPIGQMVSVQSEPQFFVSSSRQISLHYQNSSQHKSEKPQIIIGTDVINHQNPAILDFKQSAKSIGDTLIYVFSQFIDHISNSSNAIDFDCIKSQWSTLKTHLQPFNQQGVTDFFKHSKDKQEQSNQNSQREISQLPSRISYNQNNISYNNDTSFEPIKPAKSMPTSTRNNQNIRNVYNPNSQEAFKNFNEAVKDYNTLQNINSQSNTNIFLNTCLSPSAPSLLPQISSLTPPPPITQQQQGQQSHNQSNSSSLLLNQHQVNPVREELTSPLCTMTSVSRCNSFTTNAYPQVSNFDINTTYNNITNPNNINQSNNINNQSLSSIKKDIQPQQSSLQQQGLSMTSRNNKKESNWSQYKAVPISTFKLDVPRLNKHMHQFSSNSNQGVSSQTNILNDQEQSPTSVSPFVPTHQQQSSQQIQPNKRGNSQSQTRFQSPTNFQQHHNFLQQQRESLARQTSQSQERSIVQKLMYDSKTQQLNQIEPEQKQSQQGTFLQRTLSNQQMSPRVNKKEQNQQLIQPSFQSTNNLGSNFSSINPALSPNQSINQQNLGLNINSSYSLSQKVLNQIIQPQQAPSNSLQQAQHKPLQGITLLSNNTQVQLQQGQQQSAQKQQLNQSNSKTLISSTQHTFNNTQLATQLTEEGTKENDRYAYYFSKENEIPKENENKFFFDNRINQSTGKLACKQSQNKVINLNSYQVPSQYNSKQNFDSCISPTKIQPLQSKSFNTKHLLQSPTITIQNMNGRVNTEANNGKTYRIKTEADSRIKGNTIEQLLTTQISNDLLFETQTSGRVSSHRSHSKYSANSQTSIPSATQIPSGAQSNVNFQANFLKSKISNLLSIYEENNIIINNFKMK